MFSTVFWVCFRVGHVSSRGGRCNSVFGRFFSGRFFSGFVFGRCRRRGHCLQYINNTVPFADIFCRAVFQFQLFRRFFRGSGFRTSIFQSGSVSLFGSCPVEIIAFSPGVNCLARGNGDSTDSVVANIIDARSTE